MKNEEEYIQSENNKLVLELKNLEILKKKKIEKIEKSKAYFQILLNQYNNITNSLKKNQVEKNKNKVKNSPTKINKFSNFDFPSMRNDSKVISSLNSNISNVVYEYSKISNIVNESKLVEIDKEENYREEIYGEENSNVYLKRFLKKKKIGGFDKKKMEKKSYEQNQNYLKNSLLTKIKEKVDSEYI